VADSVGSWLVFAPQRLPAVLVLLAGEGVLGGAESAEPEADGPPDGPGPPGGPWVKSSFLISFTTVDDAAFGFLDFPGRRFAVGGVVKRGSRGLPFPKLLCSTV